jgi:hypothetical protein
VAASPGDHELHRVARTGDKDGCTRLLAQAGARADVENDVCVTCPFG